MAKVAHRFGCRKQSKSLALYLLYINQSGFKGNSMLKFGFLRTDTIFIYLPYSYSESLINLPGKGTAMAVMAREIIRKTFIFTYRLLDFCFNNERKVLRTLCSLYKFLYKKNPIMYSLLKIHLSVNK